MRIPYQELFDCLLRALLKTYRDPDHSDEEFREITIGHSAKPGVIFLSHTQRGDRIRIIGARRATRLERKQYEEGISKEEQ